MLGEEECIIGGREVLWAAMPYLLRVTASIPGFICAHSHLYVPVHICS